MWKSIIIVTSMFMAFSTVNVYAAGLESGVRKTTRDRIERNTPLNDHNSFNSMMTGLNLSNDVSAGLVFGLDRETPAPHDGPDDNYKGFGLGVGLSFSF